MCICTDPSIWYNKDYCLYAVVVVVLHILNFCALGQEELFTLVNDGNEHRKKSCGKSSAFPLMVMDPRHLFELLRICTLIAQGQK